MHQVNLRLGYAGKRTEQSKYNEGLICIDYDVCHSTGPIQIRIAKIYLEIIYFNGDLRLLQQISFIHLALLLILGNNNYHSVHHAYPKLPWYAIAKVYWAQPDLWKNANHGFFINGYCLFLLQHLIKPVDHPEHPGWGL